MAVQRKKSAADIINQRNRIRRLIEERYGETSNRSNLANRRNRVNMTAERYLGNIVKNNKRAKAMGKAVRKYAALGVEGRFMEDKARSILNRIKATRDQYMGLGNG